MVVGGDSWWGDGRNERKKHMNRGPPSFVLSLSQDEVGVGRDDGRRAGSTMEGGGGGGGGGPEGQRTANNTRREKNAIPPIHLSLTRSPAPAGSAACASRRRRRR